MVEFLEANRKDLCELYFKTLFLDHFTNKMYFNLQILTQKIRDHNFYLVENYFLLHYLNAPNILKIEKNLSFHFYQRLRYEVLRDPLFSPIFSKYIDESSLVTFYMDFTIFYIIIFWIRKNLNSFELLENFRKELVENLKVNEAFLHWSDFYYKFLLMIYTMNLKSNIEKTIPSIRTCLELMEIKT